MNHTLVSAPHHAAWAATPTEPAAASRGHYDLRTLRRILATWDERKRVRRYLAQMSRDNPHLIDDIGLTRRQVEAEIAKPCWQA